MEIWKNSPLAPEDVKVSNYGRIRSEERLVESIRLGIINKQIRKMQIVNPFKENTGYLSVHIQRNAIRKKYSVHRLIASAFCDNFDASLSVNHIDGNKINNIPSNLEWVTLSKNTQLQWETGLINLRGEKGSNAKLSDEQARFIKNMNPCKVTEVALFFNVSTACIYKIRKGKRHC